MATQEELGQMVFAVLSSTDKTVMQVQPAVKDSLEVSERWRQMEILAGRSQAMPLWELVIR